MDILDEVHVHTADDHEAAEPPPSAAGLAALAVPTTPNDDGPWTHPLGVAAGHSRMTEQAAGWVVEALRAHAMGERVSYDVALDLAPTPNGPMPVVVVFLAVPSMVLGELCGEMALIEPQNVTRQGVAATVKAGVARCLEARAQSGRQ